MREEDDLFIVLKREMRLPLLTREQEKTASEKELIDHNYKLVASIAEKYCGRDPVLLMDLFQEGYFGLEKAAKRFKPEMDCKFSTYAIWWIRQAILRALLNLQRVVSLKTSVPEMLVNFNKACRELGQTFGRKPYPHEIAEEMEISEEKVAFIISIYEVDISLDHPSVESAYCQRSLIEYFLAATNDDYLDDDTIKEELAEKIDYILNTFCSERERIILMGRFGIERKEEETLEAVGSQLNLSGEGVRLIQDKVLSRLRNNKKVVEIISQFE